MPSLRRLVGVGEDMSGECRVGLGDVMEEADEGEPGDLDFGKVGTFARAGETPPDVRLLEQRLDAGGDVDAVMAQRMPGIDRSGLAVDESLAPETGPNRFLGIGLAVFDRFRH